MTETGTGSASFRRPYELLRAAVRHALAADVPFMAGAIAYQAFVSIMPLLFLLVVAAAVVTHGALTDRLLAITAGQLPGDARGIVNDAVRNAVSQTGNSVISAVLLGFGAVAVFNGLDKAFTDIYDVERGANLPNQLRDAFVVLAALGVAVIAIAAAWSAVIVPLGLPFAGILRPLALVAGLSLAFYPMFYVFPEVSLGWVEVLPGVVLTAVGWTLLQVLFGFYVDIFVRSGAFGVVGGILILATFLYFGGFILLVGATLNAVLHGVDAADVG